MYSAIYQAFPKLEFDKIKTICLSDQDSITISIFNKSNDRTFLFREEYKRAMAPSPSLLGFRSNFPNVSFMNPESSSDNRSWWGYETFALGKIVQKHNSVVSRFQGTRLVVAQQCTNILR
jgi:hypothetical protein